MRALVNAALGFMVGRPSSDFFNASVLGGCSEIAANLMGITIKLITADQHKKVCRKTCCQGFCFRTVLMATVIELYKYMMSTW